MAANKLVIKIIVKIGLLREEMVAKHKKLARRDEARRSTAFTLVELLTVLVIITILIALLIPALTVVRNTARETQQKAQLTTIEMALTAFKDDYGDYPPSGWQPDNPNPADYSGTQMLTEALVGWDLLGFHPDSVWRSDGKDENGGDETYDPGKNRDDDGDGIPDTLGERVGPYLELATANVFKLNQLFNDTKSVLAPDTYVLCDVFIVRRITLASGDTAKAGTPILYYKATPSWNNLDDPLYDKRIYSSYDNYYLIDLGSLTVDGRPGEPHPLSGFDSLYDFDYEGGIRDSKVEEVPWPHRPDSYILISAGVDGLYGTSDDIRNF